MIHKEPYHALKFISNTGGKPVEPPKPVFVKAVDYEAEVKKIHPSAVCECYISDITNSMVYFIGCSPITLTDDFTTERAAWQSAYEQLKQQGKI